jgi:hypothetical protein
MPCPPFDDLPCRLDVKTVQPLVEDLWIGQIGSRQQIVVAAEVVGSAVISRVFADLVFELYWRDHAGISGEVELEPSFALAQLYRYCASVIAHRRNRPKAELARDADRGSYILFDGAAYPVLHEVG